MMSFAAAVDYVALLGCGQSSHCVVLIVFAAAGLAAGPALWFMINLAIAIKTGNTHIFMTASTSAADVSAASTNGGSSNAGLALLNGGGSAIMANSGRPQQVVLLLLTAAASPAGKWWWQGLRQACRSCAGWITGCNTHTWLLPHTHSPPDDSCMASCATS
jgi:hypothetical protein